MYKEIIMTGSNETIGAGIVGAVVGVGKSLLLLSAGWSDAFPSWPEIIHTAVLALIGGTFAIIAKIIFRKFFPRKDANKKTN